MKLLRALKAIPWTQVNGQMFVDIVFNGKRMITLVDTGTSHNFLSMLGVRTISVAHSCEPGALKTINSGAVPIEGVARGSETRLGEWVGRMDYVVVCMGDYEVVLGMEFLD